MKVYRYVQTSDNGTAPNYAPPCVTLALCKDAIRRKAAKGDLVIAFAGKPIDKDPEVVIWAGVVTDVLPFADYWRDVRFQSKKDHPPQVLDNIYEPDPASPDGYRQHPHAFHGPSSKAADIRGKYVLIFGGPDIWVFRDAPRVLPTAFGLSMGNGRRSHRVGHLDDREWLKLRAWFSGGKEDMSPCAEPTPNQATDRRLGGGRRVMRC